MPFVEETLANAALHDGRLDAAQTFSERMPASAARSEVIAKIALARGDRATAVRAFLEADDVDALTAEASQRAAAGDLSGALSLERDVAARLTHTETHPDAVAEAYWRAGIYAQRLGDRDRVNAKKWKGEALRYFADAHTLTPFSEKYLLAGATEAMHLNEETLAAGYLQAILAIDPASADAYAGLGILALRRGDAERARKLLKRSRALDPRADMVRELVRLSP